MTVHGKVRLQGSSLQVAEIAVGTEVGRMEISNWNLTKRLTASLAFAKKHTMGFQLTGTTST